MLSCGSSSQHKYVQIMGTLGPHHIWLHEEITVLQEYIFPKVMCAPVIVQGTNITREVFGARISQANV